MRWHSPQARIPASTSSPVVQSLLCPTRTLPTRSHVPSTVSNALLGPREASDGRPSDAHAPPHNSYLGAAPERRLRPSGSLLLTGIEVESLARKHPLKQRS